MLSKDKIREMVREGLKKALFEKNELKEETVEETAESVKEECGATHEEELYENGLDERRTAADGSPAGSHGRGREDEDVANSARLEESEGLAEEDVTEEGQESVEEAEVTVENRLQDKNQLLFEKLSKMWTKK